MNRTRRLPQRMCVGCREMKDKKQLIRVVRSPEGTVDVDSTGKKPGRGAYICPQEVCLQQAMKSKRLQKALDCTIPPEVFEALKSRLG